MTILGKKSFHLNWKDVEQLHDGNLVKAQIPSWKKKTQTIFVPVKSTDEFLAINIIFYCKLSTNYALIKITIVMITYSFKNSAQNEKNQKKN